MAELQGKKRKQASSCPAGWLPSAIVVQLELTCQQERYAHRSVGIARFVYNRLVANDQAGRDTGLWLTPFELEKEFNVAKRVNPSLAFVTDVSKFVAQGACRNYRNARSRWLSQELKARKPAFHRKNRTGTGSFLAASGIAVIKYDGHRRIRLPYLGSVRMTRALPEGIPYEVTPREAGRPLVRQRRVLEIARSTAQQRNPIGGRCGRGHQSSGSGQRRRTSQSRGTLPAGADCQRSVAVSQSQARLYAIQAA